MRKRSRRFLILISSVFALVLFLHIVFLSIVTIISKKLPLQENCEILNRGSKKSLNNQEFTILSWNVGYGGLGKEMDFFYEGGKRVRPDKEEFKRYLAGIKSFLSDQSTADFILLQEVDKKAKRSYFIDEVTEIHQILNPYCYGYGKNYDCVFVPLPLTGPMGRVESGIVTFSRHTPFQAERIGFGTSFPWPKQLFFLQRCFLVFRFNLLNGKELVLVNTHNSTFDKDGKLRKIELAKLQQFLSGEFAKGNYVVAGGDWNNNPVGFFCWEVISGDKVKTIDPPISPELLPGWKFAFDPSFPTNRDVDGPYIKGKTKTTIIDFFILSPNVELVTAHTIETGFTFSDHQPVRINIRLRQ